MSEESVVCVYGIPDESLQKELTGSVIVFDEEAKSDQFTVCNPLDDEAVKQVIWDHLFLNFSFCEKVGNSSKDPKTMKEVFAHISYLLEGIHLTASDLKNSGIPLLSNFLKNDRFFAKAKAGKGLFGQFRNVPAVICGAGPSLEKAIDELKPLQDKALIFAGGTALSSLSQWGLKPHFAAHIDPHPPENRFAQNQFWDVPTFFQSRAHPENLEKTQGPLLWVPGNSHDFFDEEHFDGGWNVSTFLTALAYQMGCNPIILVGVDCAHERGKVYAGVDAEEEEGSVTLDNGLISRKDWVMAGQWLSEFSKKDPSRTWIKVPGGLELDGFSSQKLSEISLKKSLNLSGVVEALPLQKGCVCASQEVKESLQKVGLLCQEMLKRVEAHFPYFPDRSGPYIICEAEMEQEMAFQRFLLPIWRVFRPVMERQMPPFLPKDQGILLNQWLFMKKVCDEASAL